MSTISWTGNLLYYYLMRTEARLPVCFLTGAALFLAVNPPRSPKSTAGPG